MLTIHTQAGIRNLDGYRVRQDESPRAIRAEKVRDSPQRVFFGDRGINPSPLVVETQVQEDTISATRTAIAGILADAQIANAVTTPRGYREVNGLVDHRARFEGRMAVLTLSFAPTSGTYLDTATLASTDPTQETHGWVSTAFTVGWEFVPDVDITVTALRMKSHREETGESELAIWRVSDESKLAWVAVPPFGANEWVEVPIEMVGAEVLITEVTLSAGVAYVVTGVFVDAASSPEAAYEREDESGLYAREDESGVYEREEAVAESSSLGFYVESANAGTEVDFSEHITYVQGRSGTGFPETVHAGRWYSVGARFHV